MKYLVLLLCTLFTLNLSAQNNSLDDKDLNKPNFIEYYDNGQIHLVGFVTDGERDGEWREYSSEGVLLTKTHYYMGKKHGEWTIFSAQGFAKYKILYHLDNKLSAEEYNPNGSIVSIR